MLTVCLARQQREKRARRTFILRLLAVVILKWAHNQHQHGCNNALSTE